MALLKILVCKSIGFVYMSLLQTQTVLFEFEKGGMFYKG